MATVALTQAHNPQRRALNPLTQAHNPLTQAQDAQNFQVHCGQTWACFVAKIATSRFVATNVRFVVQEEPGKLLGDQKVACLPPPKIFISCLVYGSQGGDCRLHWFTGHLLPIVALCG